MCNYSSYSSGRIIQRHLVSGCQIGASWEFGVELDRNPVGTSFEAEASVGPADVRMLGDGQSVGV